MMHRQQWANPTRHILRENNEISYCGLSLEKYRIAYSTFEKIKRVTVPITMEGFKDLYCKNCLKSYIKDNPSPLSTPNPSP